ncbi:MAG: polysaccharide deacetylase family protein [Pseudomonadota bacterium]
MTSWPALTEELDRWHGAGLRATLWWRDDDAARVTTALERLLTLSETTATPLALAVIPTAATPELAQRLSTVQHTSVLQHGYAHTNHAPAGEKKAEFGDHRGAQELAHDLARGRDALAAMPGRVAMFVPPWNRIGARGMALLKRHGFSAVSTFAQAWQGAHAGPCRHEINVAVCNTHVDIIDWRQTRRFAGSRGCLAALVDHLQRQRNRPDDHKEATGILSHHCDHDDACWGFLNDLITITAQHPAVTWISAGEAGKVAP